ncbi:hypothetical protein [Methylotenera sp.]|uniref:hypothetical protein n=1 Tax=Methylotenera sp. TaxID=2051956 RepID=UPI002ED832E6
MRAERIIHNNKTGEKSPAVQLNRKFSNITEVHTHADRNGAVRFSFFNVADAKEGFTEEIEIHLSEDEVKLLAKIIRASKNKSN